VIEECPHVYFVGNQPKFDTAVVEGPAGQLVRLITIPKFCETGEVVILDLDSLEVETVKFELHGET
jgi:DNA polymerase delta subunit 2